MATRRVDVTGAYKRQSKFVHHHYPFGFNARFRKELPSLEDILHVLNERGAKGAFDNLRDHGVDPGEIYDLLRMIGASSDEPIEWPRKNRRVAEQLSDKCEKLATSIEEIRWPYGARMKYSDGVEWAELPRVLRSYAKAWKEQLKHPYRSARTPRNENIIRLLQYVKGKTGQFYYAEVASLLNATDAVYEWETHDGEDRWSAENLSGIKFRARQKSK